MFLIESSFIRIIPFGRKSIRSVGTLNRKLLVFLNVIIISDQERVGGVSRRGFDGKYINE